MIRSRGFRIPNIGEMEDTGIDEIIRRYKPASSTKTKTPKKAKPVSKAKTKNPKVKATGALVIPSLSSGFNCII